MDKKVVLVTGASSGIGKAAAKLFYEKGYIVYGTSRREAVESSDGIAMLKLDVTDDASVQDCVQQVLQREGQIDVLVNNAGYGIAGAVEDTSAEEVKSQLETNLVGLHRMCAAVLPVMRRQGGGKIINISSVAGFIAIPYQAFYSVSKYAVEGYSRALRNEVAQFGIRVTIIQPGDTKTGFTKGRVTASGSGKDSAYYERVCKSVARMERDEQNGASPESVAKVIFRAAQAKNPPVAVAVGAPYKLIKFALRLMPERFVSFVLGKLYG